VIEKLNYLYKGGRCNSLQLLGANLLKLRPRINLIDGSMKNDKKYRGSMGSVIAKYAQDLFEDYNTPCLDAVAICYTTATDEMLEAATTACKNMGFKNIYYGRCGATIASHCGEHTLGILFINDGE
jgi:fatty acid-binding protein DegV